MHRTTTRSPVLPALLAVAALATPLLGATDAQAGAATGRHHSPSPTLTTVVPLDGPRGVDIIGRGRTLVSEADGSFSLVVERRYGAPRVIALGAVPNLGFAPAIAGGRHGTVWVLTGAGGEPGGPPAPGATTLYQWRPGWAEPRVFADIGAYQATDLDPDDQEGLPSDSNPFGLAALPDGGVLVADAAGNDLLRVSRHGDIETVARLRPRTVAVPEGLPEGPPAGTPIVSEAVATSVAVDRHGDYYVGELRGFPATPGTSQVWKIRRGSTDAVCDPAAPTSGSCRLYADGLTSVVDLATGRDGSVYAVTLSKLSWLGFETGAPGAEVGGLYRLTRHHGHTRTTELFAGQLTLPGGVDVEGRSMRLAGPVFGPGALLGAWLRH